AYVRVGRADEPDRAIRRAVQDRDLDLGTTGVERADDRAELLVLRVVVRVRRALARIPLAGLGGRVVAGLVGERVAPGLPAVLLEDEGDRLRHLDRLRTPGALERQVGRDEDLPAAVLDRRA